jgi:hypothetical protein
MNEFEKFLVANYPNLKVGQDVPEDILREASIAYQARQEQATQQSTAVLDSVPAVQAATVTPNADEASRVSYPQTEFDLLSGRKQENPLVEFAETVQDEPAQPTARAQEPVQESGDLRGYFQQLLPVVDNYRSVRASIEADKSYRSVSARTSALTALDNRLETEITNLQRENRWDPNLDSMIRVEVESGVPKVEAVARAFSRYSSADPSSASMGTATTPDSKEDEFITADNLAKAQERLGETDPGVQMMRALYANKTRQQAIETARSTPGAVRDAALASVRYAQSEDVEARDLFDKNALLVKESYNAYEANEPKRLALARQLLGDKAPDSNDLGEITSKFTDTQAARFNQALKQNGLDERPEAVSIVTGGPDALTQEESWRRVQKARKLGVPLVEYGLDDKGNPTANQTVVDANTLKLYAKKFSGSGSDTAPGRDQLRAEMLKDLEATASDMSKTVLERARAKSEIAKIQEAVSRQGAAIERDQNIETKQQERQTLLNEFNELYDLTATGGAFAKVGRNPVLDDSTFEESLSRLEELSTKLGGVKDPYVSRRIPALQTLRKSLTKPSR